MEEDQEQKFVCKICSKNFSSGKSLGGHMRGHLATNSAKKLKGHNGRSMGLEGGGGGGGGDDDDDDAGYGLRENPKKSWRVSVSKPNTAMNENSCKECGKEFPSLRAVSGHMRCHSNKAREEHICKQCGKGFDSMRALFGHMRHHSNKRPRVSNESVESQSEHETLCPTRRKRSRMRYKTTENFPLSNLNASSYVSEIDHEAEEAAICLMMLSRGVSCFVEFNSALEIESSENYSVSFEAKTLHQSKAEKFVCNADESRKMKKVREGLDSRVSYSGNSLLGNGKSEFDNLDSGFMNNSVKLVELEVSVDGFYKGDQLKKPELEDESGIESSDVEIENGSKLTEVEWKKDLVGEVVLDQADLKTMKSNSREGISFEIQVLELRGNSCDGISYTASTSEVFEDSLKPGEYKCRTCNKIFHSRRALGGHRRSHKTISNDLVKNESLERSVEKNLLHNNPEANSKFECKEDTVEQDIRVAMTKELKKKKDHECPICFRVFASGQALGGHKRAHYIGSSENKSNESMLTKQELPPIHNIFDLNLPVNVEKEVNDDVGFKPWWVGSDQEREPLVISN